MPPVANKPGAGIKGFLGKKVGGVPMPVVIVGAAAGAWWFLSRSGGGPDETTDAIDGYSGDAGAGSGDPGLGGGGGGGGIILVPNPGGGTKRPGPRRGAGPLRRRLIRERIKTQNLRQRQLRRALRKDGARTFYDRNKRGGRNMPGGRPLPIQRNKATSGRPRRAQASPARIGRALPPVGRKVG